MDTFDSEMLAKKVSVKVVDTRVPIWETLDTRIQDAPAQKRHACFWLEKLAH